MSVACYINGISCLSAQDTKDNTFFEPQALEQPVVKVLPFPYKEWIKPMQLRRMSTAVKMGVVGAQLALENADVNEPDAIITGTGMGCRQDSMAFLTKLLDNQEHYLNPTSFIQSTHNTIGGQIALLLKCQAYNTTYVQASASLEASLLDGLMLLEEEKSPQNLLVGSADEIDDAYTLLYQQNSHVKSQLAEDTGAILSEGANFFVLSNEQTANSYAKLLDVHVTLNASEDTITSEAEAFLKKNQLTSKDIDAVILGTNGDAEFDFYYKKLQQTTFPDIQQLHYKHLSGEYNSASGFGLWLACMLFKHQEVPACFKQNELETKPLRHILLYNQYRGKNHSFMLLSTP